MTKAAAFDKIELHKSNRKGACMAELVLTEQNFDEEVVNSSLPVVVDFWAPWCGPCKMISPVIDELAKEYEKRVKVGKVNTDENLAVASRYQITSIPTIMMFKDKKIVQRVIGVKSKADLKKLIDGLL
jgi:thioredoxin 1